MAIEKVRIVKTVKCGNIVYSVGEEFEKPIPQDIHNEINLNTGTVEVLLESGIDEPEVLVEEPVVEETPVEEDVPEGVEETPEPDEPEEPEETPEEEPEDTGEGGSRLIT